MATSRRKPPEAAPSPRRRPGRPTKYNAEVGARIVAAVNLGAAWETAAAAAGIDRVTLRAWLREGARAKPPARKSVDADGKPVLATLSEFSSAIARAEPNMEIKWLSWTNEGAKADARHATWLLTHHPRTRDRYADPAQRLIHEGGTTNTNVNVDAGSVDLSRMTDEELEQLDRLTAKAIGRASAPKAPPASSNGHGEDGGE